MLISLKASLLKSVCSKIFISINLAHFEYRQRYQLHTMPVQLIPVFLRARLRWKVRHTYSGFDMLCSIQPYQQFSKSPRPEAQLDVSPMSQESEGCVC